ncbi:MAG: LysR family transcriptional regulator [Coprobacillaceae bacterium]
MISNTFLIFAKAAESENFNYAAKTLNLTPSAISHAISKLEYELGLTLFIRNKKGVMLTIEGKELLPYAKKIIEQAEELVQKASQLTGLMSGTVRIGTFSSVCKTLLPEIITKFTSDFPNVKIIVKQGGYADVHNWIESGEVDLGFLPKIHCSLFNCEFLFKDELVCVLPKNLVSKHKNYITFDEVKDLELIRQPNENSIEEKFIQFKKTNEYGSTFILEDDLSLLAIVETGIGFCIAPDLAISGHHRNVSIKHFKPKEYREIYLAWQKNKIVLPLTKKMKKYIIEYTSKI